MKDGSTILGIIKRPDESENVLINSKLVGINRNNFNSVRLNQAFFVELVRSFA